VRFLLGCGPVRSPNAALPCRRCDQGLGGARDPDRLECKAGEGKLPLQEKCSRLGPASGYSFSLDACNVILSSGQIAAMLGLMLLAKGG
jgi:hypothetical protein